MRESVIHFHSREPMVALVGNPNCGKTALFNLLTGGRQKVANYAGVTVEKKEGRFTTADGRVLRIVDLPGTYSLHPRSPDERVTCDALAGTLAGEKRPDLVACVVDATNLRRGLRLVLAVRRLGLPVVVVLNMADVARDRGIPLDIAALSRELGAPVVSTVAIRSGGDAPLKALLSDPGTLADARATTRAPEIDTAGDHETIRALLARLGLDALMPDTASDRIDTLLLHRIAGPLILALVLFLMFQAVYSWAEAPMQAIEAATAWAGRVVGGALPEGWVRSLAVDGLLAGAGAVLVFLPQIVILFLFILLLEESGYLPRAAFLLDRLMGSAGLSGRSFIPLLSSFACAIPGIMAARTIANPRDRLVTIMIAPLMTCSARLPVYALLIGAFIPKRTVGGAFELQGLVLFALYLAGIAGAFAVAWILKRFTSAGRQVRSLMMELPAYHWPAPRNILLGLWQRVVIFLRRVGGVILVLTVALWFLASYPAAPADAQGPAVAHSFAGMLGRGLAHVFAPIGFNWQISVALVPGLAAREVAISSLGTVYALAATGDDTAAALSPLIAQDWSLATALALLAWFVFAPQCLSTLAAVRRETGGWRMPLVMAGYLFALAYAAAFLTWHAARAAGLG